MNPTTQPLTCLDDLDLLMPRDIILLDYQSQARPAIYQDRSSWMSPNWNSHRWMYQTTPGQEHISVLISTFYGVSFKEGTLVVKKEYSKEFEITPEVKGYEDSKKILVEGGIWIDANRS